MKFILIVLMCLLSITASSQDYPNKPIKLIISYPAGGDADALFRKIEKELKTQLGEPVVADYKAGAYGNIAAAALANSKNDGYTWMLGADVIHSINPAVLPQTFNLNNIKPIYTLTSRSSLLVCGKKSGINSFADFLNLAKTKGVSLSHVGGHSKSFLIDKILEKNEKLNITFVPFNGAAPVLLSVVSQQVDCANVALGIAAEYIKSNQLVPVVYYGHTRTPKLPNIPALSELGLSLPSESNYFLISVPTGTPDYVITKITNVMNSILKNKEIAEGIDSLDHSIIAATIEKTNTLINNETRYYKEIINNTN